MGKLTDYKSAGASVSLANIDGKSFTVTSIEDSDYTQGTVTTEGVRIITKEWFDIEGTKYNQFHSTRVAVVSALKNSKIRDDVSNGKPLGPLKCQQEKTKNGTMFYNLVDA